MFILYSVVLGIIIGYISGGSLKCLAKHPFKSVWLAVLAFAIQLLIFSDLPFQQVNETLREMLELAYQLEVNKHIDPFLTLSFLTLPVIPEIRLTDRGLYDVSKADFIDISIKGRGLNQSNQ